MKSLMQEELYCDLLFEGMPEKLFGFWTDKVKLENPKLPRTPLFFVKAVTGLVAYFRCMDLAKGDELLLPSKAVYTVWQAWLAYDEQFRQERTLLNTFTAENFQRMIPFKAMPSNLGPEYSDVR